MSSREHRTSAGGNRAKPARAHVSWRKGQFFSYDAIVAGAVFLLALALILSYWQGMERKMDTNSSKEASRLAQTLLTSGAPADWERTGRTKSIGIAEGTGSNTISREKLGAFRKLAGEDYESLKPILVVEREYYIEFSGESIDCGGDCSIGKKPAENAEVSSATRLVVLNGKPAALKVVLWK